MVLGAPFTFQDVGGVSSFMAASGDSSSERNCTFRSSDGVPAKDGIDWTLDGMYDVMHTFHMVVSLMVVTCSS